MPERFERALKILCLGLAALVLWQIGVVIWRGDPLAHLTIPALPTLPGDTNAAPKTAQKDTNATSGAKIAATGTNATNGVNPTNTAKLTNAPNTTNLASSNNVPNSTNVVASTNPVIPTNLVNTNNSTNPVAARGRRGRNAGPGEGMPGLPPGMTPEMMAGLPPEVLAQMAGGGMPGGPRGGMKKMELPPDVQTRVDRIINSELLGPVIHPMPMALIGISDDEAYLRATNGQTGPVKIGKEMGGIKLLRIGMNRVLVEVGGEQKELTLFEGIGGPSLMPKTSDAPSTNASTNASARKPARRTAATNQTSTNLSLTSKPKENQ